VCRTPVGLPGREVEHVVLGADEHPRRLDAACRAALRDRDAWVTVVTTDPGRVSDRLQEHGLRTSYDVECLMTVSLHDQRRADLPEEYRSATTRRDADVVAEQLFAAGGEPAAAGQAAVVGQWCVPDRIVTEPGHRRRGLGAALMSLLVAAALEQGATHGVLVASREGRRLYESLGWATVADVVVAREA
jgi:predicted GNAT family acetyltransferase